MKSGVRGGGFSMANLIYPLKAMQLFPLGATILKTFLLNSEDEDELHAFQPPKNFHASSRQRYQQHFLCTRRNSWNLRVGNPIGEEFFMNFGIKERIKNYIICNHH